MVEFSEIAGWTHNNFYHRSSYQRISMGEASADLPILLGYKGKIDPSFIDETQLIANINPLLDHGLLTGLGDDDHAIYALLAGRPGGQVLSGDTAANGNLVLRGTSHATKTTSYLLLQDNGGNVGIGTAGPSWLTHIQGQADGARLIALTLHNNTIADNSEAAIRFVNRNSSITSEANRVGEIALNGGSGRSNLIGRVSDTAGLATAFAASATIFWVPNTFGIGLTDPDASLTIVTPDSTLANGRNQIRLRSQRQTINSGTFGLIGGIDFMSNDTQLTHPGVVTAAIQAVATVTHQPTALDTAIRILTTTGTTYAEHSRFRQDGVYQVVGGINFGNSTLSDYAEDVAVWTPTPALTSSPAGFSSTYSTRTFGYTRIGNWVYFRVHWIIGTPTASANQLQFSLPVTPKAGVSQTFQGIYRIGTGTQYYAVGGITSGGSALLYMTASGSILNGNGWATGHELFFTGCYQV